MKITSLRYTDCIHCLAVCMALTLNECVKVIAAYFRLLANDDTHSSHPPKSLNIISKAYDTNGLFSKKCD